MIKTFYKQILVFDSKQNELIPINHYKEIIEYIRHGTVSDYTSQLIQSGSMQMLLKERNLLNAMHSSLCCIEGALPIPFAINMEVTSRCPLHCPQCYCDLENGEDLPIDIALKNIREAAKLGIARINISGGETLVYPYLIPLIEECREYGIYSAIAISGWGFTKNKLSELVSAGLDELSVSLNGSTVEIDRLTRDGYRYAIQTLQITKESDFGNVYINWVAHNNNIQDFMNVVELAYSFHAKGIEILGLKPTIQGQLETRPTKGQLMELIEQIKSIDPERLEIIVEDCFNDYQVLKHNAHSCYAGLSNFSIARNGAFTPCRHLILEEHFDSMEAYWRDSYYLNMIRSASKKPVGLCSNCAEQSRCLPCYSIALALTHKLERTNPVCVMFQNNTEHN